ncbi:hypothetical protein BS333_18620 [Vibrio azureus]|nr:MULTISPECIES: OmpA family protein [Vibrio harveyi group]AUI88762.1 hypothetical protein BS333_18620 [Vibrio azureus]PNQ54664.1 OmpA family protein [Vibrio agarivorans]
MKYCFLIVCALLAGCGSISSEIPFGGDMLDTAPSSSSQLKHPNWGNAQTYSTTPRYSVPSPRSLPNNSQGLSSLEMFLDRYQIAYETLDSGHVMVKLKEQVHFESGSVKLSLRSQDWLRQLGNYLSETSDIDVVIDGHTDSTGQATFNDGLSEKRAREVEKQLLATKLPRHRVFSRGFGEFAPQCSNATAGGKACNRRAELTLIVSQ